MCVISCVLLSVVSELAIPMTHPLTSIFLLMAVGFFIVSLLGLLTLPVFSRLGIDTESTPYQKLRG